MTEVSKALPPEKEAELNSLCEQYGTALAEVRKNMRFGNPPERGRVLVFLEAEANAAAILAKMKQILDDAM